jgi:predicted Zn-dependent protease
VRAVKDGKEFSSPRPPAPQAKFRILDQAKTNELAEAQRMYASSHLTLGLLYTQAGLLDEAERELRALQRANPNSVLVQQLLANVQAMRR